MASDNWGFTSTADMMPHRIISLRNRPDGVDEITWQLQVGQEPQCFYYTRISIEDATQDMIDAEQRVYDARTELIHGE